MTALSFAKASGGYRLRTAALRFLLVFAGLTAAYSAVIDSVGKIVIEVGTVAPAAAILQTVAPALSVTAQGPRLAAPGGGLNVLAGCEGADVWFLLVAALVAVPMPWRQRAWGALLGLGVVFLANQLRLIALFYAFRASSDWFATLHGLILPLAVVAVVAAWFWWFLTRLRRAP